MKDATCFAVSPFGCFARLVSGEITRSLSLTPLLNVDASVGGAVITAWFGITEVPITAKTVRDEKEVLKAVDYVHALLDEEIASGTSPSDIFVCGLSQGGALAIASVLLYPKTLGGCVVFSFSSAE